jgi:flagellar basal body-associated protein FliL
LTVYLVVGGIGFYQGYLAVIIIVVVVIVAILPCMIYIPLVRRGDNPPVKIENEIK